MAAKTVVIGAGLAGLSAALRIARDGGDVVVVERTSEIGGRAVSKRDGGFTMNLGAHAMYPRASV
jgi:phytoene dehydrogenase-like protein